MTLELRTLKQCDSAARKLGMKRAAGTYNGSPYWLRAGESAIVTRDHLQNLVLDPSFQQKSRAKISSDQLGYVTLSYYDQFDGRITRVFMVPVGGGYVREQNRNGDWQQVCDKLSSRGSTLTCASREDLIRVIRREYRSMRASIIRAMEQR